MKGFWTLWVCIARKGHIYISPANCDLRVGPGRLCRSRRACLLVLSDKNEQVFLLLMMDASGYQFEIAFGC